ncbi:MAG: hypothetical protein OHK0039_31920 [Bacteroidia bacterium]
MQYTFKTNINCGGCVARVQPHLDGSAEIAQWSVDTASPDKVLTVVSDLPEAEVMELVRGAGFEIEAKKKGLLGRLWS